MSRAGSPVVIVLVLFIAVAALVGYAAYSYGRHSVPPPAEPMIQIEKLARLVTLKVAVADILQATAGTGWTEVKGAWLVKGDALITVDMSKAATVSKDTQNKKAVLLLPVPTVYHPRVDHSKTMTYDVQRGLFVFGTGKESRLRDEAMRQAQLLVEHAANSHDTLKIARDVAEEVVRTIYNSVDWEVTVKWADAPAAQKNQIDKTPDKPTEKHRQRRG